MDKCVNKNDLISIIVPVYNMEQYMERCVNSIINQTYHNLEIILVDDGSTDHSPAMCDEYALRDGRIKVVHKPNGGLSDARNAGLTVASGNYIGYVDSDDWIEPQMYEKMYAVTPMAGVCPIMCGCCGTRLPTPGRCRGWKRLWPSSAPVRSA